MEHILKYCAHKKGLTWIYDQIIDDRNSTVKYL